MDVEKGLTESADVTTALTDESNAIMDDVSDIIGLSKLDDTLTYFKEYKRKLGDIEYSSIRELVFEGVGAADSKTWGDLANDVKSKAVYMFKKLDEKIGGKHTGEKLQDKIIYPSKPHTNKTPGHWEAMVEKADELAKNDNVSKIYLNKGLSNEIPGIKPNRRPDIMVGRKGGKIDQYEVPSKTDNIEDLIERMQDNQNLLKDKAGDIFILPPKK